MNIVVDIEQEVEKIATDIGDWFKSEASAAEKLYDSLSDEEKQAATWAYGVLAVINANLSGDVATVIIPLIQKAFPDLSLDNLQGFVDELLVAAKAAETPPLTLVDGLTALVKYLSQFSGTFWGALTQTLGSELTILMSPGTAIQKITQTAELIYQIIVKPKVAALAPAP